MKYIYKDGNVLLFDVRSFDIAETLECGQCFRFEKIDEKCYLIIAFEKVLKIKQEKNCTVFYDTTIDEFENVWVKYFDLDKDYEQIKNAISINDKVLKDAVDFAPGIRILNQEFFECLISFVISQNNRIPMIKKVIENISEKYGTYIKTINGKDYYAFPNPMQLINASEEELMLCKTGFRAKYIIDAVFKVVNGFVDYNKFNDMSTSDIKDTLISIKGVGPKVADCVLLFSCERTEVFPTDVWVKRIMSFFYFDNIETNVKIIHEYAESKFGKYAGFAQQYLFNYARELKIGA